MTLSIALVLLLVVAAICGVAGVLRRSRGFAIAAGLIVVMVALVAGAIAFTVSASAAERLSAQAPAPVEFVGATPCGDPVRSFVGGLAPGAACHSLSWRLSLNPGSGSASVWNLNATYEIPAPSNPNAGVKGPQVTLSGPLQTTASAYRLVGGRAGQGLVFTRVSADLLHLSIDGRRLAIGTAGWSYTLNRAERTEQVGDPSTAADFSYSISPRATGTGVFALFEGRTPCRGIARQITGAELPGCIKVKWRVTLLQDAQSGAPTTYKIESTLHRQTPRQGTWRVLRGTGGDPNTVVYQLDAAGTERPILLLKGDDNVLFFVNEQRQLLIGSADFSYTLNRVTESPR